MHECFKCGITAEKVLLFDAIGKEGIVKICNKCLKEEDIPLIRSTSNFEENYNNPPTVYEKLSKLSGLDANEHRKKFLNLPKEELRKAQDVTLREIVDNNFQAKLEKGSLKDFKIEAKNMLVDNFHWIIMRVRRSRKLTQKDLAQNIAEPEKAIKLAEMGILPENPRALVKKLESYLGIRLFKEGYEESSKEIGFDPVSTRELTISDLNKKPSFPYWKRKLGFLQKKREEDISGDLDKIVEKKDAKYEDDFLEDDNGLGFTIGGEKVRGDFIPKKESDLISKKDLSDEEMNRIIFGK